MNAIDQFTEAEDFAMQVLGNEASKSMFLVNADDVDDALILLVRATKEILANYSQLELGDNIVKRVSKIIETFILPEEQRGEVDITVASVRESLIFALIQKIKEIQGKDRRGGPTLAGRMYKKMKK